MRLLIAWFCIGAVGAFALTQDVKRACSIEPQGWRVLVMVALGPMSAILALPGMGKHRCDSYVVGALSSQERQK